MNLKNCINKILWISVLPGSLILLLPASIFEWIHSNKTFSEAVRKTWRCIYKDLVPNVDEKNIFNIFLGAIIIIVPFITMLTRALQTKNYINLIGLIVPAILILGGITLIVGK